MELVVRTWNLFHGRTVPEGRRLHVRRMVELVTADRPAIVALQEVPVWALERLAEWSGMHATGVVAMPAAGGPLGRWLTALHPRRFRSGLVGQANAVLLGDGVRPAGEPGAIPLNPRSFRRSVATNRRESLEWTRNRRMCQAVPVEADGTRLHVVNLHATKLSRLAALELGRLAGLLPDGPAVVCGDFNAPQTGLPRFSAPIPGIDQILVRGLELAGPPARWPAERRRHDGALLSDHAPVEARVVAADPTVRL